MIFKLTQNFRLCFWYPCDDQSNFQNFLNNSLEKLKLHATFKIIMNLNTTYSGGLASPGISLHYVRIGFKILHVQSSTFRIVNTYIKVLPWILRINVNISSNIVKCSRLPDFQSIPKQHQSITNVIKEHYRSAALQLQTIPRLFNVHFQGCFYRSSTNCVKESVHLVKSRSANLSAIAVSNARNCFIINVWASTGMSVLSMLTIMRELNQRTWKLLLRLSVWVKSFDAPKQLPIFWKFYLHVYVDWIGCMTNQSFY